MPTNKAAWIEKAGSRPFVVRDAPYTPPGEGQVVVKNFAVAINPADTKLQEIGESFPIMLPYPSVFGCDVAGVVEEVGPGVEDLKKGDRVMGFGGMLPVPPQTHANGGFQLYTVLNAAVTLAFPSHMSFGEASVIPLGWWTAVSGIVCKENLGLNAPTTLVPKAQGKTVLVWGGSSSVGCNAIQILRLAGYDVLATASKRNHQLLESLGASGVFDYNSPTVKDEILAALQGKHLAGIYDCVAAIADNGTLELCMQIVREHPDAVKKIVSVIPGFESKSQDDVQVGVAMSTALNEVSGPCWKDFMPVALEKKLFLPKPELEIVGQGLEDCQKAVDILGGGVSAKKLVVTLQ